MPDLGNYQVGHTPQGLKSKPKLTKINGDDFMSIVYRNMGNNHAYPFVWAETITFSGTSYVMASGIKFHGMKAAEYCKVVATPVDASATLYVSKDTSANTITIHSSASGSQTVDVMVMVGQTPDISAIANKPTLGHSTGIKFTGQMLP